MLGFFFPMPVLPRNTSGEVVQVVKLCYASLKLAVACGSFAPELGVGLGSSSGRAERSLLMARSRPTALAASQHLVVSEGKVICSRSCCDNVFRRWDRCDREGRAWISLLPGVSFLILSLPSVFDDMDCYKQGGLSLLSVCMCSCPKEGLAFLFQTSTKLCCQLLNRRRFC